MGQIIRTGTEMLTLAAQYLPAYYRGLKGAQVFAEVETFCLFIGYSRSGHTLVGSLLDAHPNVIIGHEMGVLKYIRAGFGRAQICQLLLENSRAFTAAGRTSKGFSYVVPHQPQGTFTRLQVIGDKMGEDATLRLHTWPWLLRRLRETLRMRVKLIHVIRNPYDNISTMSMKTRKLERKGDLKRCIDFYFSLCESVEEIKAQTNESDFFDLRHEAFLERPRDGLRDLCNFLGVDSSDEYLDACAMVVSGSPHKSRYETQWSEALIALVDSKIKQVPFLYGYSYSD